MYNTRSSVEQNALTLWAHEPSLLSIADMSTVLLNLSLKPTYTTSQKVHEFSISCRCIKGVLAQHDGKTNFSTGRVEDIIQYDWFQAQY